MKPNGSTSYDGTKKQMRDRYPSDLLGLTRYGTGKAGLLLPE